MQLPAHHNGTVAGTFVASINTSSLTSAAALPLWLRGGRSPSNRGPVALCTLLGLGLLNPPSFRGR